MFHQLFFKFWNFFLLFFINSSVVIPLFHRRILAFFHPLILTSFPESQNSYQSNSNDAVLSSQHGSYDEEWKPKEPEDGFEDATKEILKADCSDSYNEEMEPVAAIPAHLADNFITLMGFFLTVIFVSAYYY